MRVITCAVLQKRPDPNNWTPYPNVWEEVQEHIYGCEWFQVYDIIEHISTHLKAGDEYRKEPKAPMFEQTLNEFFFEKGFGWQLVGSEIVIRGPETFEVAVKTAKTRLEESGRPTASKHIHEALQALSRRPQPNYSGAIYHAAGSLGCLARDIIGNQKATLGEILKEHPDLVPRPLDSALAQVWGYASNVARHVREGQEPEQDEAELLVGLAATIATCLSRKKKL